MLPFWVSIALLSIAQGVLVAVPGVLDGALPARLRGRRWSLIPPLSVIAFVFGTRAAENASAQGLTYLALCAVPLLAMFALAYLTWLARARPSRALLVAPLFALAWADRAGLAGQSAALVLSALSCVALGVLLATVTPPRWLAAGIVAMSIADTALVVSNLLQQPNDALNAARPAADLPQLQSAALGQAVMGYGDLFIAAALGGLLAVSAGRSVQLYAAALVTVLSLLFDLLFFVVDELPATVPVALALIVLVLRPGARSRPGAARRDPPAPRRGERRGSAAPPPRAPARAAR